MPDLAGLGPVAVLVIITALCVVEATLLIGSLVPGELVVIAGAVALGPEYFPLVALAAGLGSLLGQTGGYLLGRATGTRVRYSWAGRKLGEHRWARTEALVRQAGPSMMIAVRFVAVGHTLAPILAGAMKVPPRRFFFLASVSSIGWSGVWALLGLVAAGAGKAVDSQLMALALGVVGMVIAGILITRAANRALPAEVSRSTPGC
ncbi:membrane protein DedA with SNARE-associated domain [Crossiella equi]|uniref:Membrane protein DedA with SNARE-associated domain n=2 Tax=Crossiella equi TaxID=130796 RepID=A0ABS5AI58_9PSEU|nr:membrane protein DedA with SNARE-associated domain [Crossiella equi]